MLISELSYACNMWNVRTYAVLRTITQQVRRQGIQGKNHGMGTNHYKQALDHEFTTLKFVMTPLVFYWTVMYFKSIEICMLVRNNWSKNKDKMMASFIIRRLEIIIDNPDLNSANGKMPNQNTYIRTKEWWVLTIKKSSVFEKNTWNSQVLELDDNNKIVKSHK